MGNKNILVGLFVVAGLGLFTAGLFLIGNRNQAFARHVDFYADFVNLDGLSKGSKVQVAGMDAGQVLDIKVPDSPSSRFRLRLRIDERLQGLVRTDSMATIGTEGVVGNTFVSIRPGSANAPAAPALTVLPSKEALDISDLLEQGKSVLGDVDGTLKDADGMLKNLGGQLNTTLSGLNTTVSNVNDVVVGLKEGRGPAGMLLRDETVATQIRQSLANVQQATTDLSHATGQTDQLISDIHSRNFPQKIDETMTHVSSTVSNLDASVKQVRQTIEEISEPDERGATAATNIRESLSNANATTANMADDTEALKHNFFFRPFFRHRGYYNLAHISPDKYRSDQLFTNSANYRAWLAATDLFQRNANGSEELSPHGKALLDDTLARYGDSIVEQPIVVEGYWGGDNTADQIIFSNSRANLVRQYLHSHFQLDLGNLGAVPMRNLPPSRTNHPSWDGICIVVLREKP